ncbi:6-phosphogluconolactonase [Corynebacterium propinquum]|uniref:6-phosphogluconolactonase n=1 Tax=Corynebacterium propinquum TaxID=43769 RepID=UPI0011C7DF01|nr:6-phosphogluconolactonase [Corynebacterium propinquum]MDK4235071.1 6-phosphogluconolactonase [Corynebacterium propinquum]MDK4250815.1 6-phosphogluconolactonase [Corynebacterium propinquum]QQU85324.1 6-phosphogluconolactonase [Corynebacterium propinquum]WKS32343.1 6-phosphogluconolactonase [Corynebacterium propinquum]WKS36835.1 6-phosphogluconolactonase [Corynebacterium propinquum]
MTTVFPATDKQDMAHKVAQRFVDLVTEIHATGGGAHDDGIVRVVLTGGSSGAAVLEALASKDAELDWSRIRIFFGDERNLAVDDPESNEGLARRVLLDQLDIPEDNIYGYGLAGNDDLADRARDYAVVLADFAPAGFDLHLVGIGDDGHINSLFPHHAGLDNEATVIAVTDSPKPPAERLSLGLRAVTHSDRIWFLAAGENKSDAVAQVLSTAEPDKSCPATLVHGRIETLLFSDVIPAH